MKKVIVPSQIFTLRDDTRVFGVRESYSRLLSRLKLSPQVVFPTMEPGEIESLVTNSNGVLFMGGADVNPDFYGESKHPETKIHEPERDNLELEIVKLALEQKKPILGICRGCQVLAVASGGKLIQHVPEVVIDEIHKVEMYGHLATSPKHEITVKKDSRLRSILGIEEGFVNSAHHQAVASVGEDFKIVAHSPEGICEAFEHVDSNYFCFGVQNHPEMEDDKGFFEPLLREFARAVTTGRN